MSPTVLFLLALLVPATVLLDTTTPWQGIVCYDHKEYEALVQADGNWFVFALFQVNLTRIRKLWASVSSTLAQIENYPVCPVDSFSVQFFESRLKSVSKLWKKFAPLPDYFIEQCGEQEEFSVRADALVQDSGTNFLEDLFNFW